MEKFTRACPNCEIILSHKNKYVCARSEKQKKLCASCRSKINGASKNLGKFSKKGCTGENNPFFGKKHSEETKHKMKTCNRDKSFFETKEYKEKQKKRASGVNNPMFGRTFYEIWVDKYGKEKADELLIQFKKKQSINSSGSKNPMFGKPTPGGSGNGWKGWYKNIFFRSLKELSYLVYLDKHNIQWRSAEHILIKYMFLEKERTYRPDFLINEKIVVEIKPKKLFNTLIVKAKKRSGYYLLYGKQFGVPAN